LRLAAIRLPNYARALFRANRSRSKAVSGTDIRVVESVVHRREGKKKKEEKGKKKKRRGKKKRAREESVFRFLITASSCA